MKKSVKTMVLTAMLAALYFVLSISLKIPTVGNISLDLGYIALTIAAVYLGHSRQRSSEDLEPQLRAPCYPRMGYPLDGSL